MSSKENLRVRQGRRIIHVATFKRAKGRWDYLPGFESSSDGLIVRKISSCRQASEEELDWCTSLEPKCQKHMMEFHLTPSFDYTECRNRNIQKTAIDAGYLKSKGCRTKPGWGECRVALVGRTGSDAKI